jgi:hypothetical protein
MGSAEAIFTRKNEGNGQAEDRRMTQMRANNDRMKSVIAEITAENLDLKNTLSD